MTVKSFSLVRDDAKPELRLSGRGQVLSVGVRLLQQWEVFFPSFFFCWAVEQMGETRQGRMNSGQREKVRAERDRQHVGRHKPLPPCHKHFAVSPFCLLPSHPQLRHERWEELEAAAAAMLPTPVLMKKHI